MVLVSPITYLRLPYLNMCLCRVRLHFKDKEFSQSQRASGHKDVKQKTISRRMLYLADFEHAEVLSVPT